ncbi:MAG TPA: SUMF1/EgtB/PvdO family nonheme iron enzyme [Ktedonobacterales bacterium]|nr:SUMF1/EgtB/PvdO family nonheme iron enzyme [Ktedonobacterales bacterium]
MSSYRTIFISHAHADNARCKRIADALKASKIDLWIDLNNLHKGHALPTDITRELVRRQAFVLMVTPTSDASPWVGDELNKYLAYSLDRDMRMVNGQRRLILPVRLEPTTISPDAEESNWAKVFDRFWIDGVGKPDEQIAEEIAAALVVSALPPQPGVTVTPAQPTPTPARTAPAPLVRTPPPAIAPDHFSQRLAQLGFVGQTLDGVEVITPPVCDVPAGSFPMGSDKRRDSQAFDDELPQKPIEVAAFQIARYSATVAEYACYQRATGKQRPDWRPQADQLLLPVDNLSWQDAVAYATWLAQVTGQPWRLPTEAEWEKAARGTDGRIYPWGDQWDKTRANTYDGGPGHTTPVGSYPNGASPYGAQDMAGNVWEWTSSLYKLYPYNPATSEDGGRDRTSVLVLRGGSWDYSPWGARAAFRYRDLWYSQWGFRLARARSGLA